MMAKSIFLVLPNTYCRQGWKFLFFLVEIFGEIYCFGGRRNERGGRNVEGRNIRKFRQKSDLRLENFGEKSFYFGLFRRFFGEKNRNFPTSPTRAQDTKSDHDLQAKFVFFSLAQKSWIWGSWNLNPMAQQQRDP